MTNLVLSPPRGAAVVGPRPSVFAVRLGLAGIVCSLLFMTNLTVTAWERMSVLDTTMSDYVFVPEIGWMFGAAVLCMCVAGIGAMAGLARIHLLGRGVLRLALALAVLGSLLAAVFPTDLGESLSTSAQIHRYSAGVVFFCLPIAVVLVARQLTGVAYQVRYRRALYANALVTSVVLALFMTSHLGVMPEALQELNGLFQRLLFVLELSLLGQLIVLPLRFRGPESLRDQTGLVGDDRRLHPVAHIEPPQDRADVDLHRALDDVDPLRYLAVGQAGADEPQYLTLPVGELRDPVANLQPRPRTREVVEHPPRHQR
ncbi:hypothetical protein BU204_33520 [Actinophytocola xanthii]|uniref:DUF998 domain-containing protein n=1 Tax=Actinophytocola xanthii TaxID=1912961 RepID=A0A1Q8C3I4_9PSEU|nr:hypothetical protein BU204_33520 [Actinophytocola xanthii]